MSSAYNGRIYAAMVNDKKPFGFVWDGQTKYVEGYVIVKGTKNLKAARDFVPARRACEARAVDGEWPNP